MLTNADIQRVLAHYDLGDLARLSHAAHGYVNETALVETSRGRFVVRRNHRRFDARLLHYRHTLIAWLCERDFCAPALLPTRAGATLLELDGRNYEVQAYIDGDDYDAGRPAQLASIGVTLAEYHRAVCGFAAPAGQAQPRYSPQAILALMEQLLEWDVMGELHDPLAWYTSRAVELRAALPEAAYAALPHTVIHGDIHSDNLRFRGDQVAGLLDYDQVAWDARAVDLADALVAFASVPMAASTWGVFLGPLDCARAACLLGSYSRVALLTAAEAAQIPRLVELLWLQGELGRVRSTPEGAPDYHRSVLEQGRLLSAWMRDHYEALCMPSAAGIRPHIQ